jgi:hypothetical protein
VTSVGATGTGSAPSPPQPTNATAKQTRRNEGNKLRGDISASPPSRVVANFRAHSNALVRLLTGAASVAEPLRASRQILVPRVDAFVV